VLDERPHSLSLHDCCATPPNQLRTHDEFSMKCDMVRRVYGSAAAMRMKSERAAAESIQRLPGLESSFVALEVVLGEDDTISFEDVLNSEFCIHVSCAAKNKAILYFRSQLLA